MLPLDPESLWTDIRLEQARTGKVVNEEEALDMEARILVGFLSLKLNGKLNPTHAPALILQAATSPPLCLEPDVLVSRIANAALRSSALPVPAAFKLKSEVAQNEDDDAIKARDAKIMSLMNPHKSRPNHPSARLLEIIQRKQAGAAGQQAMMQHADPHAHANPFSSAQQTNQMQQAVQQQILQHQQQLQQIQQQHALQSQGQAPPQPQQYTAVQIQPAAAATAAVAQKDAEKGKKKNRRGDEETPAPPQTPEVGTVPLQKQPKRKASVGAITNSPSKKNKVLKKASESVEPSPASQQPVPLPNVQQLQQLQQQAQQQQAQQPSALETLLGAAFNQPQQQQAQQPSALESLLGAAFNQPQQQQGQQSGDSGFNLMGAMTSGFENLSTSDDSQQSTETW